MEIRVLKYFLMVAREENITKAAALLHVTQPTLSRQLMQLEEELGVRLFHRRRHNMILTNDGIFLKRRAEEIVSLSERTKDDFLHKGINLTGNIAIGSGEFQASQYLAAIIAAFREQNPLVHFEIYSGNSDNIKERIENGILDLGFLSEPVDISKYDFIRLPVKEEWGILISEESELAKKESVSPEDLIHMPLIMTQREMLQNELINWFGPYSDQIDIVVSGNLLYNLAIMARNNIGVTLNIKLDYKYDGLCFVPLSPKIESGTVLVWKKIQAFSPAASAFIGFAKEYISGISHDLI